MEDKIEAEDFVKELIIGFGFVEGLWIYSGINPMTEIANAFSSIVPEGYNLFSSKFILILSSLTLFQVLVIYIYGGMIGILALILAYLGGIFIGTGYFGIILVLVAIFLGFWSFRMVNKISFMDTIDFIYDIINFFKKN